MTRRQILRSVMLLAVVAFFGSPCVRGAAFAAPERIRVVASTTDLGSIAASVGGDRVEVSIISRPGGDPHRVEVLPSYMVRVSRARVYLKVGLGLDRWADPIIDGSHNSKLLTVDCSAGVSVLDKPTGKVDASMGDVHPDGNPHYWLDPANGAVVADNVARALGRVDPAHAADYAARAAEFSTQAAALGEKGRQVTAGLTPRAILTYHRSWSYLVQAFGLEVPSTVEPVPGIPPTGRHLAELVTLVQGRKIRVLLEEPYFSMDAGKFLARQAGIRTVTMSASCDDALAGSYLRHIEAVLTALVHAAGAAGS